MSRRRRRRQTERSKRPIEPEVAAFAELAVVRQATRVKKLAYTRTQAAQALGISTSTFERRILPFIETVEMDWGKRFIPVDELERFLAARRQQARAEQRLPSAARSQAWSPTRGRSPHPYGARTGKESPPDRAGPQHRPGADIPGWPAVVALDCARRSRPPESGYGRARGLDARRLHHRASRASSGYFLSRSERPNAADPAVAFAPQLGLVTRLTAEDHTVDMGAAPRSCSPK